MTTMVFGGLMRKGLTEVPEPKPDEPTKVIVSEPTDC